MQKVKLNKDFDAKKSDEVIAETKNLTLAVKDLEGYFLKFYPGKEWKKDDERMVKSFGLGFGQALLFNEYFNSLKLTEKERKLYESVFFIYLDEKTLPFYLDKIHPLDKYEISEKEMQENYEKFKNSRYLKKGGPKEKPLPSPYAEVKGKIREQMQKEKQRMDTEKTKKALYGNFKINIRNDSLKEGKI